MRDEDHEALSTRRAQPKAGEHGGAVTERERRLRARPAVG